MWILSSNLPLMIADFVPCDNDLWECFLFLLDILQLCTTQIASNTQAGLLEALIHDHYQLFIRCYSKQTSYLRCTTWCIFLSRLLGIIRYSV